MSVATMKKALSLILALALCLSLCACGASEPEQPPEPAALLKSVHFESSVLEDDDYVVGENMQLNDLGLPERFSDGYYDYILTYDEQGLLTRMDTYDSDTGKFRCYLSFEYQDGLPVSGETTFHNPSIPLRSAVYEAETGPSGLVIFLTTEFSSLGKTGKKESLTKYEYSEDGNVISFADTDSDATTYLVYDAYDNLLSMKYVDESNSPDNIGTFLEIYFDYEYIDDPELEVVKPSSFISAFQWDYLASTIYL